MTGPARTGSRPPAGPPAEPHDTALPHDRDEATDPADTGHGPVDPKLRRAHEDIEQGRVDTDRGPPMHTLYHRRLRRGA